MNQEILDYKLQHWLQAKIATLPVNQRIALKNIAMCNHNTIQQSGVVPAVFLLYNDSEAKFFGQMTCKNTWACPCCTAKMMSKYKANIGDAIDALDEQGYFGFMMTFTIPHLAFESCRNVTERLQRTWRRVISSHSTVKNNPYSKFRQYFGVKYTIKCMEYTWGKNGWHPHFHSLFFIPKGKQNEILAWEESLKEIWLKQNRLITEAMYGEEKTSAIFSRMDKTGYANGVRISRTEDGKIMKALSGEYLCGWGADSEVTGNYRKTASHEDHYTPYQILEMAASGNEEMAQLYIDFCLEVCKKPVKNRVRSSPGIGKILRDWRQRGLAQSFIAKKKEERMGWRVVCWFTSEQWSELLYLNKFSPILSNILWIAANARELLEEFLAYYDIYLIQTEHFHSRHVENIFNGFAEAG